MLHGEALAPFDKSPLHIAVEAGDVEATRVLLETCKGGGGAGIREWQVRQAGGRACVFAVWALPCAPAPSGMLSVFSVPYALARPASCGAPDPHALTHTH